MFLQIYNEHITNLLDPNKRNLQVKSKPLKSSLVHIWLVFILELICLLFIQVREDVKSGIYTENLTEEHVFTVKDVNQLLIKVCFLSNGLAIVEVVLVCYSVALFWCSERTDNSQRCRWIFIWCMVGKLNDFVLLCIYNKCIYI
jgi:hypothetical protein